MAAIGTPFGINLIMSGIALLMFSGALRKVVGAVATA